MNRISAMQVGLVLIALGAAGGIFGRSKPLALAVAPVSSPPNPSDYVPVEAFLQAHCVECHNAKVQKGDISLHAFHDEAGLLKDRKLFEDVLEKVRAGEMPPKKKPRPDKAEAANFLHAIEGMFFRHDASVPLDPGHITVRRLNRAEYNNTIRDLVGVDSKPGEDFPSDDVGHGFDNIGDVLSISPVLMERYLAAAEAITQRAIPLEPIPPVQHKMGGRYLEPAIHEKDLPEGQHRPLTEKKTLNTPYSIPEDGDYIVRARVYPDAALSEGQPPSVALLVDRKQLQVFDIEESDRKKPQVVEAKTHLKHGEHRFAISMLRGFADDPKANLRVVSIEIQGPPDTRPASMRMLLACDANLSHHQQTRQVLERFASRAYRRPATVDEVDRLVSLAERSESAGEKWEAGISLALEAVLVSPKFLFRMELDDRPDTAGPHAVDEYQLASRLSYFIWSTMPDDELFALAARKELSANLEAQVRRMLKDPRSQSLVDNFAMQWLQVRRLKSFSPDTSLYPAFNEKLRAAMLKETNLFIGSIITEDRGILDLIDADYTFLNADLARFYKIADTNGNPLYQKEIGPRGYAIPQNEFVRVKLTDHTRGGVLTEASVLCVTSNPTRTSPVKRGKFVLEQILGVPPPPPPPNVPELADVKTVSNGAAAHVSLRERMEQHRANPSCANCHEHMDGIGFALENFDAIGNYRSADGSATIDPSGTLPDGGSFKGVGELKAILKDKKEQFSRCLTKKLLTYAMGRGVEYYDQRAVEKIVTALDQHDYKFSTLVVEIVKSDPFRLRRGKEQSSD